MTSDEGCASWLRIGVSMGGAVDWDYSGYSFACDKIDLVGGNYKFW